MFALSKTDNELILIIQRLMKKLLSVLILLGAYLTVFSQNIQVTGTVIGGSDREPLPGVNVADLFIISELQKSIKANKVISYLS